MKEQSWVSHLPGDLTGGTTATILAIPEAMAYGTIVFAPLGPEYIALGVVAGLIALCFSNLCAAGCGGVRVMNNGPYSMTSLMIASAVTIIASKMPDQNVNTVLGLLFLMIFLCGLFQVLFGLLKVGDVIKYIPYPVTSGLLNGTAILILLSQIRPILGIPGGQLLLNFGHVQPLTFLVGLVTAIAILYGPKFTKKIPAPFLGIGAGTLVYYVLSFSGFRDNLGPTIGAIPFTIPTPKYAIDFLPLIFSKPFFDISAELIWLAMGIALVASLQSLIAAVSTDNLLKESSNTNRELIGQGLGNIVSALFGGIVSAGSQSRAMANISYGGRTANSRLASGMFALAVLLFISPLLAKLPKVVLAATLVVLAFSIFDTWSFNLASLLISKGKRTNQIFSDLFVVILVTATLVFVGVFEAVGAGIFISIMFFILRMGKNVIRREYNGKRIRSNVHRSFEEIIYLEEHGHKIMVYELEGSLFFGTADKIAGTIDEVLKTEAEYIVVDLKRVSDIDSTGANILVRIMDRCIDKDKHMILSSISLMRSSEALSTSLSIAEDQYVKKDRYRDCYSETIDDALGWAEDKLLAEKFGEDRYDKKIPLAALDVLSRFSETELNVLGKYVVEAVYEAGDVILEQGTPGEQVYFIVQGKVQVVVDLPDGLGKNKIATLCPGTIFGEMAVIDRGLHSANVVSETHVICYYLTKFELNRFNQEQPEIAHKLMIGFARELSKRIRIANRITTELKG
jgi:anti-anti-sigma factor